MNRINIVTLGVTDIRRSLEFYRDGLGFTTSETADAPTIVFFSNRGTKLALYPYDLLAEDVGVAADRVGGFCGLTLSYNALSESEVDEVMARAMSAGATLVKAAAKTFWGGYGGYFADPDGYYWEVAYGPDWEFDAGEMLVV